MLSDTGIRKPTSMKYEPGHIDGLTYISNFLTQEEHDKLLDIIDSNPFSTAIHRRQQFYGETYYHTTHDLPAIQPTFSKEPQLQEVENEEEEEKEEREQNLIVENLPISQMRWVIDKILARKEQFFGNDPANFPTQCLVNEYVRNMGIASHYDDDKAFGDVIALISLVNPVYMTMRLPKEQTNKCLEILDEKKYFLEPGSLLILHGDARYRWRHGIQKTKHIQNPFTGEMIHRTENFRRVSVTIRKLLDGRKQSAKIAEASAEAIENAGISTANRM
jgi:alkylated DNA repair dioxygenase AlkB